MVSYVFLNLTIRIRKLFFLILGILLPQSLETGISHLAVYKLGGIALPLFTLFGADALKFRLLDSQTSVLITNLSSYEIIKNLDLPELSKIILISDEMNHDKQNLRDTKIPP